MYNIYIYIYLSYICGDLNEREREIEGSIYYSLLYAVHSESAVFVLIRIDTRNNNNNNNNNIYAICVRLCTYSCGVRTM
jgi:hypothetical protein